MKPELQEALIKDFPNLYKDELPISAIPHPFSLFYFEVSDGWEPIIRRLSEKLEPIAAEAYKDPNTVEWYGRPFANQIKEKYGGLRFYTKFTSEEIDKMIDVAEAESIKTCETCGKPGELRDGGWILTLCDDCHKKNDKNV